MNDLFDWSKRKLKQMMNKMRENKKAIYHFVAKNKNNSFLIALSFAELSLISTNHVFLEN